MKRVLVTGASGFVGANLARRALADGHEVHLLVRKSHAPWRVRGIAADVRLHEADLHDGAAVDRTVSAIRPEWVFHLAAHGAYPTQTDVAEMVQTNVMGCVHLLDACARAGVEAFVQAGSSSEYGPKGHPAEESEALEPGSHYAITKAAATHHCAFTARSRDLHAVTARLYSVYGPYEEPTRLVPTLALHALERRLPPLASPRTARDFVHVDDAVAALLALAARTDLPRGSVYNVCTGVQLRLAELVAAVRSLLGIDAEPQWASMPSRAWDTDVWVGSRAAIERDTDWRPRFDFMAGFRATLDWLESNPSLCSFYADRILGAAPRQRPSHPVAPGPQRTP